MADDSRNSQNPVGQSRTHSNRTGARGSGATPRFGRSGAFARPDSHKPRIHPLIWAGLAIVVVPALFYFNPRSANRISLGTQTLERQAEETRRSMEEIEKSVERTKREMEEALQRSKSESEARWKKFDEQMAPLEKMLPQQPQSGQQEQQEANAHPQEKSGVSDEKPALSGHADSVVWLSVSPDGRRLLSAGIDRSIKLWDLATGLLIRDVGRHEDMARAALFLPGGDAVMSAGDDGLVATWSLSESKRSGAFLAKEHGSVRGLALSADGRLAAGAYQSGTLVVWDRASSRALHVLTGHGWSTNGIAISPDAKTLISGDIDGEIRTWNLDTGQLLRRWKGHERGVYAAVFAADGKRVLTASGDGLVKLWDAETGTELRRYAGHAGTVYALALSADGKLVLSGSLDGTARIWDFATGLEKTRFENPSGRVYAVAFAADGSAAIGGDDGAIRIWSPSGGEVRTLVAKATR